MYPWPREMIRHLQVTQILVRVTLGPILVHVGGRFNPEKSQKFHCDGLVSSFTSVSPALRPPSRPSH